MATDSVTVVQRVLQLLNFGDRNSTYKHAVLVGLLDLCIEHTDARGFAPSMVTTRQLAEKVVELYWQQVATFDGDGLVLQQNSGRQGVIVREVEQLRQMALTHMGAGASASRVKVGLPAAYERAVRNVEWKLIEMPLPKLQRVERQDERWLFVIGWDDGANMPSKSAVSAYQAGDGRRFDNRILFQPGVSEAFAELHSLLRPFVEQAWARDVAVKNRLDEGRLHRFLFGADRVSLGVVRPHLITLQRGRCFYCGGHLGSGAEPHVDHFLPWARHADNGLHNLVVADARCNGEKSDFLAGAEHLRRWRQRNLENTEPLVELSATLQWELSADRTLGAARALYLNLPTATRLWAGRKSFERASRIDLERALLVG